MSVHLYYYIIKYIEIIDELKDKFKTVKKGKYQVAIILP